jgi:uncharacterized protein YjaZ
MAVIRTDKWLEKYFNKPLTICEKILGSSEEDLNRFYKYLLSFGMYIPNRVSRKIYDQLVENNIWATVERLFSKYQLIWRGPDIPIYIFPLNHPQKQKSGVSFEDKMFLFLSNLHDEREIEALIIHEYHHVCRMNKLKKPLSDYCLLDSIIMEGLAEHAVQRYLGKKYNASWVSLYTNKEIKQHWDQYLQGELKVKKTERKHDSLLFGLGRYPTLLGYAAGYKLITNLIEHDRWPIKRTFAITSEEIMGRIDDALFD